MSVSIYEEREREGERERGGEREAEEGKGVSLSP